MKNKILHVCFDLDGTLIDSHSTIYKSTTTTLDHFSIRHDIDEHRFNRLIGKHFSDIFNEFGIVVDDLPSFIKVYKKIYFDFIDESKLYPGIPDLLKFLKEKNIAVTLLTTKAQDQADLIIDHFDLRKYFSLVVGRREGMAHKPSPEPLLFICNELNINPAETLMTGDTELDIQCGKNVGTRTCAVTYGYRTIETLKKEQPDYLINRAEEIIKIFQW
ncbi:MAG: HAD-IA family hydrolase [Ignavibacteriales bacterium]|nr:MAG: HAD-IA family hydrolase [Ignavibacteriales bacterium]